MAPAKVTSRGTDPPGRATRAALPPTVRSPSPEIAWRAVAFRLAPTVRSSPRVMSFVPRPPLKVRVPPTLETAEIVRASSPKPPRTVMLPPTLPFTVRASLPFSALISRLPGKASAVESKVIVLSLLVPVMPIRPPTPLTVTLWLVALKKSLTVTWPAVPVVETVRVPTWLLTYRLPPTRRTVAGTQRASSPSRAGRLLCFIFMDRDLPRNPKTSGPRTSVLPLGTHKAARQPACHGG
ncbi:MAG: hypothetical protein U0797_15050 [Gemmataceae bacterium]